MNKSKDKRIKKLNRKRIWPSVLGLFVIMFIFMTFATSILLSSILNVITVKLTDGYEMSTKVAELCKDMNQEGPEIVAEDVLDYIDIFDEIEAVSIASKDGKQIWSSNQHYPDKSNISIYTDVFFDSDVNSFEMIIEDAPNNAFVEEDGKYTINENIIKNIDFTQLFLQKGKVNIKNVSIFCMKLWYIIPLDDIEVFVLNNISVYLNDLLMLLVVFVLVVLLMVIFIIYYLITLLSVIASQRRVTKVLYTDIVTGGDNWLSFVKKATRLLKRNYRNKYNYTMVHLRMEKYRSFCTCFGVREGEELLERFYRVLKKRIKRKETMAHYEKADFALLLRYTDQIELVSRIEEIEQALNAITPNIKLYFTVGVCQVEKRQRDVEELYNNASSARGMIGEDKENRVAFFDIEMKKQQLWERKVEDEMERALKNKEFKVYLQPKYSAKDEQIAGAEALVRWIHPTEGFVPPNRFIPIFERNGFILQLDDYMLEEVARQQAKWIDEGSKVVPISVNISRAHFTKEDLAEHICKIVDQFKIPHNVIELELTESAFFDDKQVLMNTVEKLREYGFIVSMDDFGAGYSSLNSLKELHIDVLKIDADFFRNVDSVERGMLIVSEVIDLAKKLDMMIVAEGIESREQVDFLASQECDLIQGYYFAKPMPIDEFEERYKTNV